MITLALDTAFDRTAVALTDGRRLAVCRSEDMDRGHAERLLPLVAEVMAEAGLTLGAVDRLAVTVGPGSFTGIRVGVAAARGLALALGRPAVGIGTLPALAASAPERPDRPVLAAIDARRGEIYAALFAPDGTELVAPFAADAAGVLARLPDDGPGGIGLIIGNGAPLLAHQAMTEGRRLPPVMALAGPDPLAVARLGAAAEAAAMPVPLYVRAPDAKPQRAVEGLFA